MKFKTNPLKIDIDYAIREYTKCRNDKYLLYLLLALKDEPLYIAIQKDTEIEGLAKGEKIIKRKYSIEPSIYEKDDKKWFCAYTYRQYLAEKVEEDHTILQARFRDLAIDVLEREDISGILLNHQRLFPLVLKKPRIIEFVTEMNKFKEDLY